MDHVDVFSTSLESVANGRQAASKAADEGSTPSTLAIPASLSGVAQNWTSEPLAGVCAPPVAVKVMPRPRKTPTAIQAEVKSILDSKPDTLDIGSYSQLGKQIAALSLIHTRAWKAHEIAKLFGWPVARVQAWISLSKGLL